MHRTNLLRKRSKSIDTGDLCFIYNKCYKVSDIQNIVVIILKFKLNGLSVGQCL